MRNHSKFVCFLLLALAATLATCKHDPLFNGSNDPVIDPPDDPGIYSGTPCSPDTVYFDNDVLPLLVSKCSEPGCHNEIDRKEGVITTSYDRVMSTMKNMTQTDPSKNELLKVTTLETGEDRMPRPPRPALSTDEINLLKTWISQGAQNNRCNENYGSCDSSSVSYSGYIQPLIQKSCVGCHNSANAQGNLRLDSYSDVRTYALNGVFYASLVRSTQKMPLGGKPLDACSLSKIKVWIDRGAPQD